MFCKFCGKELQDGEVCGCAGSQQAAAAQAQQTSGAAQAATDQMSGQVNAGQADAAGAQGTQFNTAQMQQKANEYMQQGMEAAGNVCYFTFNVPNEGGTWWHVFDYDPATDALTPVNAMSYSN